MHYLYNKSVNFYVAPLLGNLMVSVGTMSSCIQMPHDIFFYKIMLHRLLQKAVGGKVREKVKGA